MSNSSQTETLTRILHQVSRRLRWLESLQLMVSALIIGLTATFALIFASHRYPLAETSRLLALGAGITLSALIMALLYAWLRPRPQAATAQLIDQRAQLAERFSTAWELTRQPTATAPDIIQAQLADTLHHLKSFQLRLTFPLQLSWPRLGLMNLLMIAIIIGILVPNPQTAILAQQAQAEKTLQEQVAKLQEVQTELLNDKPLLETAEGQELTETLNELLDMLKQEELTPSERLAALAEAEQKLTNLEEKVTQESTLNQLAETFNQFNSTTDLAKAIEQRNMEKAQELLKAAPKEAAQNPAAAQEMAQALEQAAQQAQQAGNEELAQTLKEAAEAMKNANGNPQAAQAALDKAAQALGKAGQTAEGQQAMQDALKNIQEAREQLRQQQNNPSAEANGGQSMTKNDGQGHQGGAGHEDPTGHPAEGLNAEKEAPDSMKTDNGPGKETLKDYESLAVPEHLGGEGGEVVKPDEQGATGGVPVGEARINPDPNAPLSEVPYNEVYNEYRDNASQALDENPTIPPSMRGYLREYFGALEPK